MPTGDAKCRCHRKSASQAPSMNSVSKSVYILFLVVILVFHAALPLLSLNPKPAVKAAVPAQTQPPSTNDMGNAIALSVFDSLWGRMECKITGSAPAFKLGYKCTCAAKRLQCSVRKTDDKPWTDACAQLKDSVLQ